MQYKLNYFHVDSLLTACTMNVVHPKKYKYILCLYQIIMID